ncbi:hypothetical protein NWE61_05180 [Mycoplasmopsis felis]|uniref:hypothetical protein n=1 Tax=Mycoplasmopsis felis TaxID=33923 RepID=UPI0021E009C0|nr:hypothetical protein [Mycoplasmopsis felis]MCU9934483.1 hypothetical protein [Mycoplasmopsis felis]
MINGFKNTEFSSNEFAINKSPNLTFLNFAAFSNPSKVCKNLLFGLSNTSNISFDLNAFPQISSSNSLINSPVVLSLNKNFIKLPFFLVFSFSVPSALTLTKSRLVLAYK